MVFWLRILVFDIYTFIHQNTFIWEGKLILFSEECMKLMLATRANLQMSSKNINLIQRGSKIFFRANWDFLVLSQNKAIFYVILLLDLKMTCISIDIMHFLHYVDNTCMSVASSGGLLYNSADHNSVWLCVYSSLMRVCFQQQSQLQLWLHSVPFRRSALIPAPQSWAFLHEFAHKISACMNLVTNTIKSSQ